MNMDSTHPRQSRRLKGPPHQGGSATLLIGLLLLIGAGILTFSAGRTSVVEQRIANNEVRSTEARQAAQAGLEYARSWLSANRWLEGESEPSPPSLSMSSGEGFTTTLTFSSDRRGICVRSDSSAISDTSLSASLSECYQQQGLFNPSPDIGIAAPWILGGCIDPSPTGSGLFLPETHEIAAISGQSSMDACLPQGDLNVTAWRDNDQDRIMDIDEPGASTAFDRMTFSGCPASHCAWDQVFSMPFETAVGLATAAGHLYGDTIPCGASAAPGIYLKTQDSDIRGLDISGTCMGIEGVDNDTIGTPQAPILIIVPSSSGCPTFDSDVSIYGILYYESESACASRGWGGAEIHGAVIWEANAAAPETGSQFIMTDYGTGSALNQSFQTITQATGIPGTWRDWK